MVLWYGQQSSFSLGCFFFYFIKIFKLYCLQSDFVHLTSFLHGVMHFTMTCSNTLTTPLFVANSGKPYLSPQGGTPRIMYEGYFESFTIEKRATTSLPNINLNTVLLLMCHSLRKSLLKKCKHKALTDNTISVIQMCW